MPTDAEVMAALVARGDAALAVADTKLATMQTYVDQSLAASAAAQTAADNAEVARATAEAAHTLIRDLLNAPSAQVSGLTSMNGGRLAYGSMYRSVWGSVFLYDTTKDSDGGAWRKRCMHTSWYKEAPGSYRGTRREFPSIAAIASTGGRIWIFDLDDPAMPVWMQIEQASGGLLTNTTTRYVLTMLNGLLVIGNESTTDSEGYLRLVDFPGDRLGMIDSVGSAVYGQQVAGRNGTLTLRDRFAGSPWLKPTQKLTAAAPYCRDVQMAALPCAPIDPVTDLPKPCILFSHSTGTTTYAWSIVTPFGTAHPWSLGQYPRPYSTAFLENGDIAIAVNQASYRLMVFRYPEYLTPNYPWASLTSYSKYPRRFVDAYGVDSYYGSSQDAVMERALYNVNHMSGGRFAGEALYHTDPDYCGVVFGQYSMLHPKKRLYAHAGPLALTGYAPLDAKMVLSGGQTGSVTGATLLDETFSSGLGSYHVQAGSYGGTVTGNTGALVFTQGATATNQSVARAINAVVGETYYVEIDLTADPNSQKANANLVVWSYGDVTAPLLATSAVSAQIGELAYVTCPQDSVGPTRLVAAVRARSTKLCFAVSLNAGAANASVSFDNLTIRVATMPTFFPPATRRAITPVVMGTLTRNPTATGAELTSYGGFSGTNNLYGSKTESQMDPGTGEVCIKSWVKVPSGAADRVIFARRTSTGAYVQMLVTASGYLSGVAYDGTVTLTLTDTNCVIADNYWHHVVFCRRGIGTTSALELWVDGNCVATLSASTLGSLSNASAVYRIGCQYDGTLPLTSGEITLLSYALTTPTHGQMAFWYGEEKPLIDGAPGLMLHTHATDGATVDASCYDPDLDMLYIGHNAEAATVRFQGLVRAGITDHAVSPNKVFNPLWRGHTPGVITIGAGINVSPSIIFYKTGTTNTINISAVGDDWLELTITLANAEYIEFLWNQSTSDYRFPSLNGEAVGVWCDMALVGGSMSNLAIYASTRWYNTGGSFISAAESLINTSAISAALQRFGNYVTNNEVTSAAALGGLRFRATGAVSAVLRFRRPTVRRNVTVDSAVNDPFIHNSVARMHAARGFVVRQGATGNGSGLFCQNVLPLHPREAMYRNALPRAQQTPDVHDFCMFSPENTAATTGVLGRIWLQEGESAMLESTVIGQASELPGSTERALVRRRCLAYRDFGGDVTIQSQAVVGTDVLTTGSVAADFDMVADTVTQSITIPAEYQTSLIMAWRARVKVTKIGSFAPGPQPFR